MVWAVVLGLAIWGDIPDRWTFVGAAVVAGSGLYILRREKINKINI
jgi:drug/metabolite transporter (DMT)-like permease